MEILSTAEKIKRSRIYKGITLKELCGDRISISKMSCIENGKIKADEDTLRYIAGILDVDYNYLVEDVYEQIVESLKLIDDNLINSDEVEKVIKYNLEYANDNSFEDLSFKLMHRLFNVFLSGGKFDLIHNLISDYYELFKKCSVVEQRINYYGDMASFFYEIEEYTEAINYYENMKECLVHSNSYDTRLFLYINFYEAKSFVKINEIEKAYDALNSVKDYTDRFHDDYEKSEYYHLFAMVNLLLNKNDVEDYIHIAYELQKEHNDRIAKFKAISGKCYYLIKENEKALNEIKEAIHLFPKDDNHKYTEFLLGVLETLLENKEYEVLGEYIDDALNLAIDVNENELVERAYYFKGMIYQRNGMYFQAEIYMNLSTDTLLKFANDEQRYKRYNEMADLYYNLGEHKEAIKYFTLAVNLDKKR